MKTIPKKRYGQHFLRDTGVLNRILALIQPMAGDLMLEVGAGDGALSTRLAPKVLQLLALEIDGDLMPRLTQALAPYANAVMIAGDVLSADLPAIVSPYLSAASRLRVVGNLPYNIGTAIIEKLLLQPLQFEDMTFMLQLETAERIIARPGSKDYGFFSVYCQHRCEAKLGLKVSPACFVPRPKVHSAMISLRPRRGILDTGLENDFIDIAKAAFAFRRKMLVNSLRLDGRIGGIADVILSEAGIDGARRAEELTIQEYELLASIYHKRFGSLTIA
jgi:16S rRNA (adenine1518-N6/adenine1519-N6)-dimethyltransferase